MVRLSEAELRMFRALPEADLIDLALELNVAVGKQVSVELLIGQAVDALAALGRREGLPFSDYDREDLAALPPDKLAALADLLSVARTPDAVVKASAKVCRSYRSRPQSQIPMMLPMLLPLLVRKLVESTTVL